VVRDVAGLGQARGPDELRAELAAALNASGPRATDWRDRLNE
jgi:hypothetical protein